MSAQDFQTYALFRDGSRLAIGSPVVIAGVRVGEIDELDIDVASSRGSTAAAATTSISRSIRGSPSAPSRVRRQLHRDHSRRAARRSAAREASSARASRSRTSSRAARPTACCARSRARCPRSITPLDAMHDFVIEGPHVGQRRAERSDQTRRRLARGGPHRRSDRDGRSRDVARSRPRRPRARRGGRRCEPDVDTHARPLRSRYRECAQADRERQGGPRRWPDERARRPRPRRPADRRHAATSWSRSTRAAATTGRARSAG